MKYYRFMSLCEFNKLTLGLELTRSSKNMYFNCLTTSTGFCFLPEHIEVRTTFYGDAFQDYGDENDIMIRHDIINMSVNPLLGYELMKDSVSYEILVEFECSNAKALKEARAIYPSPFLIGYPNYEMTGCEGAIIEYCIPQYNNTIMRPVRYSMNDGIWYSYNYI